MVGNGHGVIAALGEQDDEIGHLEGFNGAEEQGQHEEAPDIGEGDGPETPPGPDAVNGGSLIKIFGHRYEASEHQQHDEGRPHPGIGKDNARDGPGLVGEQDELLAVPGLDRLADQAESRVIII